jgi:hypothetical protein
MIEAYQIYKSKERGKIFVFSDKDFKWPFSCNSLYKILVGTKKSNNIGFTDFSIKQKKIFARIKNLSNKPEVIISLCIDSKTIERRFKLKQGDNILIEELFLKDPSNITLEIKQEDNFAFDNKVVAIRSQLFKPLTICYTGSKDNCLIRALKANPDVKILFADPKRTKHELAIYYEIVPKQFDQDMVVINPPDGFFGIELGEPFKSSNLRPAESRFFRSVRASEIKISGARAIKFAGNASDLIYSDKGTIMLLIEKEGKKALVIAADLKESLWRFYPSYPNFWKNYIDFVKERRGFVSKFLIIKAGKELLLYVKGTKKRLEFMHPGEYTIDNQRFFVNLLDEDESNNEGSYLVQGLDPSREKITSMSKIEVDKFFIIFCIIFAILSFSFK